MKGALPLDAQLRLKAAAAIADPVQRRAEIDRTYRWIDDTYPDLMKRTKQMKVMLKDVRLAFPALFEAKTVNGEGKPAFSASLLFDAAHPAAAAVNAAVEHVAKEKWGAKATDVLKSLRAGDKVCLHDGDRKAEYDGFPGNLYVSARNETRPLVIDSSKQPLVASDGKPYPRRVP